MKDIFIIGIILNLFCLAGCRSQDFPINMSHLDTVEPIKIVEITVSAIEQSHKGGIFHLKAKCQGKEIQIEGFRPNDKLTQLEASVEIRKGKRYIVALYGPLKNKFTGTLTHDVTGKTPKLKILPKFQCLNLYGDRMYQLSDEIFYLDTRELQPLE